MLQMFDEVHKFERRAHGLQCVYCKRFLSQLVVMSEERREAADRKCKELQSQVGEVCSEVRIKEAVKRVEAANQLDLFQYKAKRGV